MRRESYTCDICGRERGPANHWWAAWENAGGITFAPWPEYRAETNFHLCSEECCHKFLSRFLGGEAKKEDAQ